MTEENIQQDLPKGWCCRELGLLCKTTSGGTPNRKEHKYYNGEIPWLKSGELNNGRVTEFSESITKLGLENSSAKVFPKGTLLIALYGATVGKLGILDFDSATNQALCAIFPPEQLRQKYLFWFLIKHKSSLMNLRAGGAQPNISQKVIREISLPIPPYDEQERIVGKVEELFSDLDAGVAALEVVRKEIKRYRQAVLKNAFEGKLTEKWRKENKDKIEPASKLLERIAKEREKETKGKKQKKQQQLDTSTIPELPEKWEWATIEGLSANIVDCLHSTAKFVPEGKFCIDTTCIEPTKILFEKARFVSEEVYQDRVRRLVPTAGDILFAREGTIGTALVVPGNIELCLGQRMMMFRCEKEIIPEYYMYALLSPIFRNQWKPKVTGTTAPHVNIRDLRMMALPVCSIQEQEQIVLEIERCFSIADQSEKIVEDALKQSQRLRQSILKRAFEGKLVPQDPNEEPAHKLLERIKKEKGK